MNTAQNVKRIAITALLCGGLLASQATAAEPPVPAAGADKSTMLTLKASAPLPGTWLQTPKVDPQSSRNAEQAMANVVSEINRISGYTSPATLNPNLGSIAKLTATKADVRVEVKGTLITVVTKDTDPRAAVQAVLANVSAKPTNRQR